MVGLEQIILIVFVLVCAAMIGLILLQQGKGADAGASFGGGSSQTMFGPAGSGNALTRGTSILAVLFFACSFALAVIARDNARDMDDAIPVPTVQESDALDAMGAGVDDAEIPELPEDELSPAGGEEIPTLPEQ